MYQLRSVSLPGCLRFIKKKQENSTTCPPSLVLHALNCIKASFAKSFNCQKKIVVHDWFLETWLLFFFYLGRKKRKLKYLELKCRFRPMITPRLKFYVEREGRKKLNSSNCHLKNFVFHWLLEEFIRDETSRIFNFHVIVFCFYSLVS